MVFNRKEHTDRKDEVKTKNRDPIPNLMDFKHASESFKRRNPLLFGVAGLSAAQPKCGGRHGAAGAAATQTRSQDRVVVSLVVFRRTPLDDDNLTGGLKWLRDAIAKSLGIDDGDKRIQFEYGQIVTRGREGTAVKIEKTILTTDEHG